METQKLSVFAVSIHEHLVFRQKPFPKCLVCHIVRQQFSFFRVIGAADIAHTGHIPQRFCFIRKIVIKFPNFGSNTQTLVPGCFCDLQIGSKCTAVQQFFRALRRIRPAYHLGRTKIARSSAACNVNPIFAIPCRNLAISRNQAVAAVVKSLQKCRAFLQRLLLGKLCGYSHSRIFFVAARAQNVVNIILRNEHRKSGGCLRYTLRFCDGLNLFCLWGEEGHLRPRRGIKHV